MADPRLRNGPLGARLIKSSKRHYTAIRDGFNSAIAAHTTRWHLPRSERDIELGFHGHRRYAIVVDRRVIGTCGLQFPMYSGVELVIAIFDERMRRKGIGTFAVRALCAIAFDDLRMQRVELGVYTFDKKAIRVYERCGFEAEARLRRFIFHEGRWQDALWMSLLRSEWTARRRATGS